MPQYNRDALRQIKAETQLISFASWNHSTHRAGNGPDARISLLLQLAAAAFCALQAAIGGDTSSCALQLAAARTLHLEGVFVNCARNGLFNTTLQKMAMFSNKHCLRQVVKHAVRK